VLSLHIQNGRKAGKDFVFRQFPIRIGRLPSSDLRLEEPGVLDEHLEILWNGSNLVVKTCHGALALVNSHPVTETALRSGDVITAGETRFLFHLSPVVQGNHLFVERVLWGGLAALCVTQVCLLFLLMR
jgi:pSer/pThr/pTyr-binding forkhead associated (FHA) protein